MVTPEDWDVIAPVDPDIPMDDEDPDEDTRERSASRGYRTLSTLLLLVVIVLMALLLLRQCGGETSSAQDSGGGAEIQELNTTLEPGSVTLWLRPGVDIETVLERHGLAGSGYARFRRDTYVISAQGRDPKALVERLKRDKDLYDAGYLYTSDEK